jgi:hypothetical protein
MRLVSEPGDISNISDGHPSPLGDRPSPGPGSGTDLAEVERQAAKDWGVGSPQYRRHLAFAAYRCPDCGEPLLVTADHPSCWSVPRSPRRPGASRRCADRTERRIPGIRLDQWLRARASPSGRTGTQPSGTRGAAPLQATRCGSLRCHSPHSSAFTARPASPLGRRRCRSKGQAFESAGRCDGCCSRGDLAVADR